MMVEGNMADKLQKLLIELEAEIPEIEASAVVSAEGLPVASALPRNIDETRVAAITAAMLNMGERAAIEFSKGNLSRIIIHGTDGILLSMAAGENAVLTVSTTHDVKLGILLLFTERTAEKIQKLLSEN